MKNNKFLETAHPSLFSSVFCSSSTKLQGPLRSDVPLFAVLFINSRVNGSVCEADLGSCLYKIETDTASILEVHVQIFL